MKEKYKHKGEKNEEKNNNNLYRNCCRVWCAECYYLSVKVNIIPRIDDIAAMKDRTR